MLNLHRLSRLSFVAIVALSGAAGCTECVTSSECEVGQVCLGGGCENKVPISPGTLAGNRPVFTITTTTSTNTGS